MGAWALWYWLFLVVIVELFSVRYVLYAVGLLVGGVVLVAGFLFALEFDLLGVMILTTYSSVFILLALLVVQFAPLNGPAGRARLEGLDRQNWLWVVAVVGAWGLMGIQSVGGDWVGAILWQDLLGAGGEELGMASSLVHELLYRVFVWEVLWVNILLGLAFVVYAVLVRTRGSRLGRRGYELARGVLAHPAVGIKWSAASVRSVHALRRQTRRSSSSLVRFRGR